MRTTLAAFLLLFSLNASALSIPQGVTPTSGWTFGPVRVRVFGPGIGCTPGVPPCRVQVFFGDVEAQVLEVSAGEIIVIVPAHEPEVVDVRVVVDGAPRLTLSHAFGWSATGQLDPPNYTPLLVPVPAGFEVAGADGTLWKTELKIFNGAAVELRPVSAGGTRWQTVPPWDVSVRPGQTQRVLTYRRNSTPGNGVILHIPTPLIASTHFSLRVRNLSAEMQEGTELPVVPFEEFRRAVTLIDIPTDPQFRATLRIYHWSETRGLRSRVTIYAEGETHPLRVLELASTGQTPTHQFFSDPAYAQVDLLTPEIRANADNIRVEIDNLDESAPPIWAFVSVTHNATHQVTAIVPKTRH